MRLPDWQLCYEEFVQDRTCVPFAWGVNDCALFAVDCVLATTGVDHGAEFRGYSSALQAKRLVKMSGGLSAIATKFLGNPVLPAYATVGDVVLVEIDGAESLGISNGSVCIGPGLPGIITLDNSVIKQAWKI